MRKAEQHHEHARFGLGTDNRGDELRPSSKHDATLQMCLQLHLHARCALLNYLPFAQLVHLEQVDERTYRSTAPPFSPGGDVGIGRAYGGHVYMQAAWAACQTVGSGFLLHHVSGNFLLPGLTNLPFIYKVHLIRDGRSYATRIVNVTQAKGKGICFTCTCSFKLDETSPLDAQEKVNIEDKYQSVLAGKRPEDFEECPGMDVPWYWKRREETGFNDAFPGLEARKVDMGSYNDDRHPLDRRQLILYRTLGEMTNDPNMHLCAHLYASDRNSLFIVANHFDVGDIFTQMGSLVHTVVFHTGMKELLLGPSKGGMSWLDDPRGRWFCKEDFSDRIAAGRGLFHSKVWAPDGTHVISILQDGMIRVTKKPNATPEEKETVRRKELGWKPREKL
ncbi:Thioesterase/thiol ester dehydrase-isomerase [Hortaea werneckii]|nr:Thioesterase/thiol ester dehydrase-isomerase [Hortaea werneckii]